MQVALVHGGTEPGLEQRLDRPPRQQRQHFEDGRQRGHGTIVATQAEQQQVPRAMRVEGGLGVEHEVDAGGRADLTMRVRSGGHEVLDQVATVFGQVADRLAEPTGRCQQHELARRILRHTCGGGVGRERQFAYRQSAQHDRTRLGGVVGEVDQRVVHLGRHDPRCVTRGGQEGGAVDQCQRDVEGWPRR